MLSFIPSSNIIRLGLGPPKDLRNKDSAWVALCFAYVHFQLCIQFSFTYKNSVSDHTCSVKKDLRLRYNVARDKGRDDGDVEVPVPNGRGSVGQEGGSEVPQGRRR